MLRKSNPAPVISIRVKQYRRGLNQTCRLPFETKLFPERDELIGLSLREFA